MNLPLILKIITIIFFIYFLIVFYVYSKQRSLLYVPNIDNYDDEPLTIRADEVFVSNTDGNTLRSLFYKNPSITKNTLLMFHGNAGPIENRFYKINKLAKYNQNILLISWRSYSGNEGTPSEQGLYDDALSAINWLNNKDISVEDIIIYGESLGTAVTLEVAQNKPFKAIILEAPFTSMIDAAKFHYPYLPVSLMLKDRYLSSEKIKNTKSPIFIMHARGDDIVPFWMGEKMFELANEPKQSYFIDENVHLVTYDDQLMKSMDNFYQKLNLDE
jgi:fermentation-respiration switch protein FrsA (DUF1100 family)